MSWVQFWWKLGKKGAGDGSCPRPTLGSVAAPKTWPLVPAMGSSSTSSPWCSGMLFLEEGAEGPGASMNVYGG